MKQISVMINEQQEKFLKMFAQYHHVGAEDNRCTHMPIHVVQSKQYSIVPFSKDIADYYKENTLVFSLPPYHNDWETDETAVVQQFWWDFNERMCPIEVKPYQSLKQTEGVGVNGTSVFIQSYADYFRFYGVELYSMGWQVESYQNIAYFFILKEAEEYLQRQKHNLVKPHIETHGAGFGNNSEYHHFWSLLLDMGTQLITHDVTISLENKK